MNHLHIILIPDYSQVRTKKELSLIVNLTIDGVTPLHDKLDYYDLHALIASTKQSGTYFIWTCSCGIPGCAGYEHGITVQIDGDTTHWQDNDNGIAYTFNASDLKSKAGALAAEIQAWQHHAKSLGVAFDIVPFYPEST